VLFGKLTPSHGLGFTGYASIKSTNGCGLARLAIASVIINGSSPTVSYVEVAIGIVDEVELKVPLDLCGVSKHL
jgi:hypothetical protein